MASVSSVNSNSLSSIYGNRNVISGLASGMDTEGMIENAVSGIRTKIANLSRQGTKFSWKQEAYRGLSDQLVQFSRKYTSYTSSTNLMSASFFDKAVKTTAGGEFSKYVSATGKSRSNVELLSVDKLASAARYANKNSGVLASQTGKIEADSGVNLSDVKELSTISGYMSFAYGSKTVSINFDAEETFNTTQELADAINQKLAEEKLTVGSSGTNPASDYIKAMVDADGIKFVDVKGNTGNDLYIKNASTNIQEVLGFRTGGDEKPDKVVVDPTKLIDKSKTNAEYISEQKMTVNFNGVTKSFNLPEVTAVKDSDGTVTGYKLNDGSKTYDFSNAQDKEDFNKDYIQSIQDSLNLAYGSGKITVGNSSTDPANEMQLSFVMNDGATGQSLSITSNANKTLKLDATATSYLNTGKTLGDLLGSKMPEAGLNNGNYQKIAATGDSSAFKEVKDSEGNVLYKVDSEGYRVKEEADPFGGATKYYRVDTNDEDAYLFKMEVNGVDIGQFSKNTAMESVMLAINNNKDAGVSVSYSKLTNEFVFTANETGSAGRIGIDRELSNGKGGANAAADLFGAIGDAERADTTKFTAGEDAKATVRINGTAMDITRSTNTFDLDGLSVTVNGTFTAKEAGFDTGANSNKVDANKVVTFSTVSDADKIVDAVKSMIEDYNEMVTSIKEAYGTMPATKADKSKYEPLTDEEKADLSETAIKNYEEKAKQGLLFADQDLSSLYNKLKNAMSPAGSDGSYLRSIGITTDYTEGLTTIQLDENALRDALSSNPDAVKEAFTKTKESGSSGSSTNGIMQTLKSTLDAYAKTDGDNKGILIKKAGSKYSATSLMKNSLQESMDNIDTQISKWEDKLSDKVDYYTSKFTQLEKLIAQMNSQSSYLMSLGGQ